MSEMTLEALGNVIRAMIHQAKVDFAYDGSNCSKGELDTARDFLEGINESRDFLEAQAWKEMAKTDKKRFKETLSKHWYVAGRTQKESVDNTDNDDILNNVRRQMIYGKDTTDSYSSYGEIAPRDYRESQETGFSGYVELRQNSDSIV